MHIVRSSPLSSHRFSPFMLSPRELRPAIRFFFSSRPCSPIPMSSIPPSQPLVPGRIPLFAFPFSLASFPFIHLDTKGLPLSFLCHLLEPFLPYFSSSPQPQKFAVLPLRAPFSSALFEVGLRSSLFPTNFAVRKPPGPPEADLSSTSQNRKPCFPSSFSLKNGLEDFPFLFFRLHAVLSFL